MDVFAWLIVVALVACVAMHLFGHSHLHGRAGGEGRGAHPQRARPGLHEGPDDPATGEGTGVLGRRGDGGRMAVSGHRRGRGGCH